MLLLRRPSVAPEPPGGLALLSGDPIFDGLVGLWVPTISARNLVGDSALFNAAPSAESGRIAARFAGTISSESAILSSSFSFAMAFNTGTPTTQSCVIARGPNSPNSSGFAFNATHANPAYAGAAYVGSSYSIIGKPTGGALAANTRYVIGAKASSAGGSVYWDGVRTATSGALSALNTTGQLTVGQNSAGGDGFTTAPSFEWLAVWSKQIDDDLMARAHLRGADAFFQSRRVFIPVSASGGTDYPVTQTESATGSDTASCLIGYAPAATEAGSASDAASAAMAAVVAIIEAASAADSVNGTASGDYTATITEAATASSLEAAVSNYLAAISESASASDSASASLPGEYSVSISEAASAIETAVCAMSALVTINEAAAAADASNWVGAITYTRAPRGSGYPGTKPTTTRGGQTNTTRPTMANTRR